MSLFSSPALNSYVSSATTFIKKSIETKVFDDAGSKGAFIGMNAPLIGRYGVTITSGGTINLGRFKDPRATLRDARDNKVVVPPDYGNISSKPIPATRGGDISSADLSYDQLKEQLLRSGKLFEDPEFPPNDRSLYFSQKPPKQIQWLRPHEICSNPEFITGGASRFDVRQGELGDCWLLAAIACLSMDKKLFEQVVAIDQSFTKEYCGLFRFHFWNYGEWKEVVVDDRLPTYQRSLVYIHSTEKNEFWSALLEKAYAKLCGSYEALKGGTTSEALEDFTGGIFEMFDLKNETPPNLLQVMLKSQELSSLMACSIQADPNTFEARLPNGLIMGHAYSVTSVKLLDISVPNKTGKIPLVRVRNPWGDESEWKGAWSDKSKEWSLISPEQRQQLGLTFDDDGEFWMSYQDFVSNFEKLEICHLGPQSMGEMQGNRVWEMCIEEGCWKRRVSAGGCRNFLDTFWINPQYVVSVEDPDENDEENKGTLIVGLMQKNRRKMRQEGADLLTIGYAVYKLPEQHQGTLDMKFFKYNASVARSPAFINLREVCGRHRLDPGHYAVIPSTFQPNEEAEFMLRIFSEKKRSTHELDDEIGETQPATVVKPLTDVQVEALQKAFNKVAGDDGEIDADELRDILNCAFTRDFTFDGFSLESCRSMIAMMDFDRSGMLSFPEFRKLWDLLRVWKSAFKQFDVDKSGSMNSIELRNALKHVGFSINNSVFSTLVMRFSRRDGSVPFDSYVICCARLQTLFEVFKATPKNDEAQALFSESEFINTALYL
ncbi:Calpain-B isoform 3 [Schistosoma japonicum]|uniref:Calpain-B isoform 3 n=1 Tax=Schistosoma japonicum TaxID=6182 RepID=A0A4Z2DAJ6_SCHJA|nr:Calpain-B isoform 3 [Schistosoma japonicum]